MSTKAHVVQIAELAREDGWSPLRMELGVQSFGINAWTAKNAGDALIGEHDETPSGHEELYLVMAGQATFTVGGEELEAVPGTVVFVADPASKRSAVATVPGTTVVALGGRPQHVYEPRAWEVNAQVFSLFEHGELAEAKRLLEDALTRYDDKGALLYNLACAEAKLGETDQAFVHLQAGIAERPGLVELARTDSDLDALRADPRFDDLVAS